MNIIAIENIKLILIIKIPSNILEYIKVLTQISTLFLLLINILYKTIEGPHLTPHWRRPEAVPGQSLYPRYLWVADPFINKV